MLKDFSKQKWDIVIQAGQSNSEGYGHGDAKNPVDASDRVWYLDQNQVISQAGERVIGNAIYSDFSLSFAREYIKEGHLAHDRNLLILRCAVGGTGFLGGHWRLQDRLYLQMLDMIQTARALNDDNRFVAFLWHQGEDDANLNADYATHYTHLHTLISSVRQYVGLPDLPVVAGDFVQRWKTLHIGTTEEVVQAIHAVMTDLDRAGFVETQGLPANSEDGSQPPNEDHVHFSREALMALGERYYAVYAGILKGAGI